MHEGLLCPGPGCRQALRAGQKVCSPRCRAAVWRRAKEARDRELRELLRVVQEKIDAALHRLAEPVDITRR